MISVACPVANTCSVIGNASTLNFGAFGNFVVEHTFTSVSDECSQSEVYNKLARLAYTSLPLAKAAAHSVQQISGAAHDISADGTHDVMLRAAGALLHGR
jgi:hypothetical protein